MSGARPVSSWRTRGRAGHRDSPPRRPVEEVAFATPNGPHVRGFPGVLGDLLGVAVSVAVWIAQRGQQSAEAASPAG